MDGLAETCDEFFAVEFEAFDAVVLFDATQRAADECFGDVDGALPDLTCVFVEAAFGAVVGLDGLLGGLL